MKYYLMDKTWNFTSRDGMLDLLIAEVKLGGDISKKDKEPNVTVQIEKILYSSGWFIDNVHQGKWVHVGWNDITDNKRDPIVFIFKNNI